MSAIEPRFPTSNAWISVHELEYIARDVSPNMMQIMARQLLTEDKAFHHLLKRCRDYWYIAVLVGQTTLTMSIYVPYAHRRIPETPSTEPLSRKRSVFFRVTGDLELTEVDELTECRLRITPPTTTSVRHLRANEVEVCRQLTLKHHPAHLTGLFQSRHTSPYTPEPELDLESGSPYRDITSD